MIRNYFLINLLLIMLICFLGIQLYEAVEHTVAIPTLADVQKAEKKSAEIRRAPRKLNVAAIDVISNKDLFKPTRTASRTETKNEDRPEPQNKPKLFATIILNDMKSAIMQDPDTKTTKSYKIKDSISGYQIVDILKDKVVLSYDGDMIDVKLRDSKGIKGPARRTRPQPSKTRITNKSSQSEKRRVPSRRRRPAAPRNTPEQDELEQLLDDMEEIK